MNWIKENKFLAGLLAVLVLGVGAFGYLILGARGRLAEATDAYESAVAERTRLHNLKPYPSAENVKELMAQKAEATAKITELHKALASSELPVEPMTAVQFQDKLRAAVTEVTTLAGTTTKLPEKFFLGFERYETATPDVAAAPLLGRELKAIQWLVTRIIENKVGELKEMVRDPLPAEGGAKPATPAAPPTKGSSSKGGKDEKPSDPLVQPHGLDLSLIGEQGSVRAVLNDIVGSKEQFFIVRLVSFLNEKDRPPTRDKEGVAAAPAEGADPNATATAPAATPATPATTYIVGTEKVAMTLRLEIVDFVEPAEPPAAK
jgi:hypothetical protein